MADFCRCGRRLGARDAESGGRTVPAQCYVGEVAKTGRGNLYPGVTPEEPRLVVQKLVKLD